MAVVVDPEHDAAHKGIDERLDQIDLRLTRLENAVDVQFDNQFEIMKALQIEDRFKRPPAEED